jgi:hypothetical protein
MANQRTIEFVYELPGGLPLAVQVDLAEESGRVMRCFGPNGYPLDTDAIWIDTGNVDVGLMPLTFILKQEAGERA